MRSSLEEQRKEKTVSHKAFLEKLPI
jgi:hypothetical protein